ncbi:exopolysaccharide biosynthesis polyprenyl glycosylphosphotransferase [bacterium]|nr:exopolysaccharide biosynthesis polyprenyl glycosylphosphotransferase [bacterium]
MDTLTLVSILIFSSVIVSLIATKLVIIFSLSLGFGDKPNERKIHTKTVPTMGGIGIFLGFCVSIPIAYFFNFDLSFIYPIVFVGFLVVLIGIWDDSKPMNFSRKFIAEFIAALILVFYGYEIKSISIPFYSFNLGVFSIPFTIFWIIGITNAINLIDGLDGLAGGISFFCSLTFGLIALLNNQIELTILCFALLSGILGFLFFNFHPAKIFMGDTGSLLLGFTLAAFSIKISELNQKKETMDLFLAVVILIVPIFDTLIAIFRRLRKKRHPFKPDREHTHHRLIDLGLTHLQAVFAIYVFTLIFCGIGLLIATESEFFGFNLLIIFAILTILAIKRLGYLEDLKKSPPKIFIKDFKNKKYLSPINLKTVGEKFLLLTMDILIIVFAFLFLYWLKFDSNLFHYKTKIPIEFYYIPLLWMILFWTILFAFSGLYKMAWETSRLDKALSIFKTTATGIIVILVITSDGIGSLVTETRIILIVYGFVLASGITIGRWLIIFFEKKYKILEFADKVAIIVGAGERGEKLIRELENYPKMNYKIVGFLVEESERVNQEFKGHKILGTFEDLPKLVTQHKIQEVLVSISTENHQKMLELLFSCVDLNVTFKAVPDLYDVIAGHKTTQVYGIPLIRLFPNHLNFWQLVLKRTFDFSIALVLFLLLLPFSLFIFLAVKLTSKGPGFIVQERVGKNGYLFKIYNFRSMAYNSEESTGPVCSPKKDERITKIGKVLRKYKLDEIPQLVNVIKGEMSLVGPKPERLHFVEKLQNKIPFYTKRLVVRPGITGWAQIKGKKERSLDDTKEKMKFDLYYLENIGLFLDVKILIRTFLTIISGKGE